MNTTIERVKVSSLLANPENLRADVGDIDGLAQSITENGLLQPMCAFRNEDGKLVLIAGHRRLAAIESLNGTGPKEVDVVVVDGDVDLTQATTEMLVENLQWSDLNPIEEAIGYARLSAVKIKQADIAKRVGVSPSVVSRRLTLLTLPEKVRDMIAAGDVDLDEAEALVRLRQWPEDCEQAAEDGWSSFAIDRVVGERKPGDHAAKLVAAAERAQVPVADSMLGVCELNGVAGRWHQVRVEVTDDDPGKVETVESALEFADVAGRPEPHCVVVVRNSRQGSASAQVWRWEPTTKADGTVVKATDVDVDAERAKAEAKAKAAEERMKAKVAKEEAERLARHQQIVAASHKGQDLADVHLERMLRVGVPLVEQKKAVLAVLGVESADEVRDDTTGKLLPVRERWESTWQRVVVDADRSKPAVRNRLHVALLIGTVGFSSEVQEYLGGFETT